MLHSPAQFLTGPFYGWRCWGLCFGILALLGCQPGATASKTPEQVIEESKKTVEEAQAVITAVQETGQPTAEVVAPEVKPAIPVAAKPVAKNDPLKDVAPSGPVVPYFNPLTVEETSAGWISLFDGHSLFGWEANDPGVNWSVADDSITADSGPKGLLLTYTPFSDYQFRCDYRMSAGGNSGVFLRTLREPKDVLKDCYEVNIVDEHPEGFLTGAIVGLQKTDVPIKGSGDWHTLLLAANGTKITIAIDGNLVCVYDDTRPEARRSGLIGLQKNAGKIEFKNIALQPLNQKPLYNGTGLAGWRVVPGSKGEFTFEDGTIHVKGGEGFLESESQHKDFVLQAQARTNAIAVNTGIFFRAEAGTEKAKSNGYEMQIDNSIRAPEVTPSTPQSDQKPVGTYQGGIYSGDLDIPPISPSAIYSVHVNNWGPPANAGTGAIFRRVNARRIVCWDKSWATVTLIASGPRISTYVDGYAVVHWEDTRKLDPNPRKGLRLDAGHFSLQGHDPTTDASFRAITVSDLP